MRRQVEGTLTLDPIAVEVRRAKGGDRAAMAALVHQHADKAYRVAYAIVGNHHDAQDVVQDAFVRAFRTIHQIQDEQAFSAWLLRIVANQGRDLLRRTGVNRRLVDRLTGEWSLSSELAPDQDLLRLEKSEQIRAAIDGLPPLQRAALVLYYSGEFTTNEVASMLKKPSGSVRRLLADAYKSLRRLLRKEES